MGTSSSWELVYILFGKTQFSSIRGRGKTHEWSRSCREMCFFDLSHDMPSGLETVTENY